MRRRVRKSLGGNAVSNISDYWNKIESELAQLRSQNTALEAKLKELEELHTMELAAVSTASIQNTPSTITDRIAREHPYWSVAYSDTCRAVDREVKLIAKVSALEAILEQSQHVKKTEYDSGGIPYDSDDCIKHCPKCAYEALKKGEPA